MRDASPRTNLVLSSLPLSIRQTLAPDLKPRYLHQHETLDFAGDVIFPIDGVISLMKSSAGGLSLEAACVGYEGVFALSALDDLTAVIQVPGEALTMTRSAYERRLDGTEFRDATARYHEALLNFAMQTALCQAFHIIEERLAYWLLVMYERSYKESLYLTQEFLAAILAVQRPSVSIACGRLEDQKLIAHSRGKITITDVVGLEHAACACYGASGHVLPGA
jgi:CRP-like cAMP-binding protein